MLATSSLFFLVLLSIRRYNKLCIRNNPSHIQYAVCKVTSLFPSYLIPYTGIYRIHNRLQYTHSPTFPPSEIREWDFDTRESKEWNLMSEILASYRLLSFFWWIWGRLRGDRKHVAGGMRICFIFMPRQHRFRIPAHPGIPDQSRCQKIPSCIQIGKFTILPRAAGSELIPSRDEEENRASCRSPIHHWSVHGVFLSQHMSSSHPMI